MQFSTIGLTLGAEASYPQAQKTDAKITAKTKGGAKLSAKLAADPLSGQVPAGVVLGCQSGNLTMEYNTETRASMVKLNQNVSLLDDFPTEMTYQAKNIGGKNTSHNLESKVNCSQLMEGLELKLNTDLGNLSSNLSASMQKDNAKVTVMANADGLVGVDAELKNDMGTSSAAYKHGSRDVSASHKFKDMYGLKVTASSNLDNLTDVPRMTLSLSHDVDLM